MCACEYILFIFGEKKKIQNDHQSFLSTQLTTSGASMSCRKEWRLRVDSGWLMRVEGQCSEVMDLLWPLQWRNHT